VRPDIVVGILVLLELTIMFLNMKVDIIDFIELLSVGSIGSLHMSIELRRMRRKLKKENPLSLAGLLKLIFKLWAAIDLDGLDWKRKFLAKIMKKVCCGRACLPPVGLQSIKPEDHIPCTELKADFIGTEPDLKGIHLHQVPGTIDLIALRFPDSISRLSPSLPGQLSLTHVLRLY
jgi:hypothetical protein